MTFKFNLLKGLLGIGEQDLQLGGHRGHLRCFWFCTEMLEVVGVSCENKGFEANSNSWLCKCCWNNLILRGGQSELASEEGDVRAGGGQVLLVPADHVHRQDEKILVSTQEVAVVLLRCGDWVSWQCPPRWKISPAHNHGSPPSCWRTSQSCLTKVKVVFLSVDSSLIWRKTR